MEIDIYQQCPCHTGKKIKFCCGKDIVNDLNQIMAKSRSKQSLSALDHIDRVMAKLGERDCLLTLKTFLLINTGEIERAQQVNQRFLRDKPNHPMGKQHEALIHLANGDVKAAVESLQDAMEAITGNEIPLFLANAFRIVGTALFSRSHLFAARAHLQFAQLIRAEADKEIQQLILETFRLPSVPLILKADYRIEPAPSGAPWAKKYENVIRAMNRGMFRKALEILIRIDQHWPNQKIVVRAIAIAYSILADEQEMSRAWRRLSKMSDIQHWQAVEYETIAQILSPEEPSGELEISRTVFNITNLDLAFQLASSTPLMVPADNHDQDPFGEGPAPRFSFFVLDRDKRYSAENLAVDDLPCVTAEVLMYGKQTDRPARLVVIATENRQFEKTRQVIVELFADQIMGQPTRDLIAGTSTAADALSWNWHLPDDVTPDQHKELIAQRRRKSIVEHWPRVAFRVLGGKTPIEAAQDPSLKIPLEALVLNLEQSAGIQLSGEANIRELKQMLNLGEPPKINATELGDELLTPLRMRHINFGSLSDEQLLMMQSEAMTIGNFYVLRQAIPEILKRGHLSEKVPRDVCYSILAQLTEDDTEALGLLNEARKYATASGRNAGHYWVQEFELRLTRGITEKLPELLQTIQMKCLKDPAVEFHLRRVLEKFGLINPDGRSPRLPSQTSAGPSERVPDSPLWMPDQAGEAVAAQLRDSTNVPTESKLWVPGDD